MRVAALYDIHGNLPALEAVLREIDGLRVDRVVVGGDVVPGPMPAECVAALLDLAIPVDFIVGNGENDTLALLRGEALDRVPAQFRPLMAWVAEALPDAHTARFAEWPLTVRRGIEGLGQVLFCHATPRNDNEIFTGVTPEDRLLPAFETAVADLVVCGHTHMQFDRRVGGTRIVNAGSVGMPYGVPGAYWLLLGPGVEMRHTPYDYAAAAERIGATDYPDAAGFPVVRPPRADEMVGVFEAAALRRLP